VSALGEISVYYCQQKILKN